MTIVIKVNPQDNPKQSLIVRKTLDGKIMILDHGDIDIVIDGAEKKIICFPKSSFSDDVYATQDRLFNFLGHKGVIKIDTVKNGNAYASLEAEFPDAVDGIDALQMVVFTIGKFISEEKPHEEEERQFEEDFEERLTNPDAEDSTELGEVPHEEEKGSIPKVKPYYRSSMGYGGSGFYGY